MRKRGLLYFVMVAVVAYVLLSAAIAIATVDKCGDESDAKHWRFVPPSWECDSPNPFVP